MLFQLDRCLKQFLHFDCLMAEGHRPATAAVRGCAVSNLRGGTRNSTGASDTGSTINRQWSLLFFDLGSHVIHDNKSFS